MPRNVGLRDFLRARRADVWPADVGLEVGGIRRVPGLRREEVALLAGVSVDYYVRFEQGRDVSPSDSVLDAIARVLRLTQPQRAQLYTLARGTPTPTTAAPEQVVLPNVQRLLKWLDTPAHLTGRGTASLGDTALYRVLVTDFSARPPSERFFAHWLFLDPFARELYLDWEEMAREVVGVLRASVTRWPADTPLAALVAELSANSEAFVALWNEHDVVVPGTSAGFRHYRHPVAGEITLFCEVLPLPDDQWLYVFWPERGSAEDRALDRLRALVAEGDGAAQR